MTIKGKCRYCWYTGTKISISYRFQKGDIDPAL